MTKYAVSVGDVLFYVYSLCEMPSDLDATLRTLSDGAYALFILPSAVADIAVFAYDNKMQHLKEPRPIFEALSVFLSEVRGLPLPDIEVEFLGKRHTVAIFKR